MAWTHPRTWTVGEVANAAMMNTHLRDNLNHIMGSMLYDNSLGSTGSWDTGSGGFSGQYKHLIGILSMRNPADSTWRNDWAYIRFNNDSGGNYDTEYMQADGTVASAGNWKGQAEILLGLYGLTPDSSVAGSFWFLIPDYASTTYAKSIICRWGAAHGTSSGERETGLNFGHWTSTAAINRIQIGGRFVMNPGSGSRFTLYGLL